MKLVRFVGWSLLAAAAAFAQDAPELKAKTWEAGIFAGSSYGLDSYRAMGGANVGYGVTKVIFPYAEFSYLPGIAREERLSSTVINRFSLPISDFHGGLHLRVPIPGRVVPYAIIGAGMIHIGSGNGTQETTIDNRVFATPLPIPSSTEFAVNFGGGARIYIKERWGIRIEAKAYKPTGRFTDVFGRVAGGLFWQF